jgi:hypothetical protein
MDRQMAKRGIIDAKNNFKSENWWARQDLNLGPTDYESAALTAELQARVYRPSYTEKSSWTYR